MAVQFSSFDLATYLVIFILNLTSLILLIVSPRRVEADPDTDRLRFKVVISILSGLQLLLWLPQIALRILGLYLQHRSLPRRQILLSRTEANPPNPSDSTRPEEVDWESIEPPNAQHDKTQASRDWNGIIGFFHPFCNAGGGGERVLWAAIRATQRQYPKATCVVYTGDHEAKKEEIVANVKNRFNIRLQESRVHFLYLTTRRWVLAATWPRFTLLGQSLGSLVLAFDAFSLLVPDIFVDTMGYAYTLALAKHCFPRMPTGAYVHYPTISTDMLSSLDMGPGKGLNAGAGKGLRGFMKRKYWQAFAWSYGYAGEHVDVVMTNSSWTQNHMRSLWGRSRSKQGRESEIAVLFPPVAVEELKEAIKLDAKHNAKREKFLVYIAQFRPEKNHTMIIQAFAEMLESCSKLKADGSNPKLILVGSVRDSEDAKRVYELRLLAHELKVKEDVEFVCDASWPEILNWLGKSSIGVNGMWNEHFGIGVVEYQAAGLISVVNNSGGPKMDIVVDFEGGPTGFYASTVSEYAGAFLDALSLSPTEAMAMRTRARASAKRFTEVEFRKGWTPEIEKLVNLLSSTTAKSGQPNYVFVAVLAPLLGISIYNLWTVLM